MTHKTEINLGYILSKMAHYYSKTPEELLEIRYSHFRTLQESMKDLDKEKKLQKINAIEYYAALKSSENKLELKLYRHNLGKVLDKGIKVVTNAMSFNGIDDVKNYLGLGKVKNNGS